MNDRLDISEIFLKGPLNPNQKKKKKKSRSLQPICCLRTYKTFGQYLLPVVNGLDFLGLECGSHLLKKCCIPKLGHCDQYFDLLRFIQNLCPVHMSYTVFPKLIKFVLYVCLDIYVC